MRKIKPASLSVIISLILISSIAILLIIRSSSNKNSFLNTADNTYTNREASSTIQPSSNLADIDAVTTVKAEEEPLEIVVTENVEVSGNTAEFDLEAKLYEDSGRNTYLRLEYYLDGISTVKELDSNTVKELEGIFENRNQVSPAGSGYRVKEVYLNPNHVKAYIQIEQGSSLSGTDTSIYSYDLRSEKINLLYSGNGTFTELFFSPDKKHLSFSFYDNPSTGAFKENSLLSVLNCETDGFLVKDNRDKAGNVIGGRDNSYYYDYKFLSWDTNSIIKLSEACLSQNAQSPRTDALEGKTVLYDILENKFIGEDNEENEVSEVTSDTKTNEDPAAGDNETENKNTSESADDADKVLKVFYNNLKDLSLYGKGMELLTDDFILELAILKQFGVQQLGKKDIDIEQANIYKDILMSASLDSIIGSEVSEDICTVFYYQSFELGSGEPVKMPMEAKLTKTADGWRISMIRDGDSTQKPFNGQ